MPFPNPNPLIHQHISTHSEHSGELFDLIVRKQRLPEREACALFHQLVDGVEYLHSLEVRPWYCNQSIIPIPNKLILPAIHHPLIIQPTNHPPVSPYLR